MISDYVNAALSKAHYELIEDEEPYYGEIRELPGVWASGRTLEECRQRLAETVEGWVLVRNSKGLDVPMLDGMSVSPVREMKVA